VTEFHPFRQLKYIKMVEAPRGYGSPELQQPAPEQQVDLVRVGGTEEEAARARETEQKLISQVTNETANALRANYGINDLTTIESVSLRRHVENAIVEARRQFPHKMAHRIETGLQAEADNDKGKISIDELADEAMARWLSYDYGLEPTELTRLFGETVVRNNFTRQEFVFEDKKDITRDTGELPAARQAEFYAQELRRKGQPVTLLARISDKGKRFIKLTRDRARILDDNGPQPKS
jgi:hypothetical protein